MAIAEGRITRPISFGSAGSYIDGSPLGMIVKMTPKRSLVWQGAPQVRRTLTARADPGLTGSIAVPVTDQEGYTLGDGTAVVAGELGHINAYDVVVDYFAQVNSKDVLLPSEQVTATTMVVPTGDLSPMDLDTMLVESTWGGLEVALPDWITPAVDAATLAAQEATAAVATIGGKLDAADLDTATADLLDVPSSALAMGVNAKIAAGTGIIGASDWVNSWWCAPRTVYNALRQIIYQGGVDASGAIGLTKYDLRRQESSTIKFGVYEVDDHNVTAVLAEDDLPIIAAYARHAVEKYVRVRIGTTRHDFESLATASEQLLEFPAEVTYVHMHRRPGTSTIVVLTRNGDGWYKRISREWGAPGTWDAAVKVHGASYCTFNVYDGIAYYAVTTHPITTPNNYVRYLRISLETGVIRNAVGSIIGNLWSSTDVVALGDMTVANQSYDTDAGHNSNRTFDILPDGSILAMQLDKTRPEVGGMYGIYRFATTGATTPNAGQSPDSPLRGWTFEPIVASGTPVGYYVSSYVGGMTAGANEDEVYLDRCVSPTDWRRERWVKSGGAWTMAELVRQATDGTKLGRVQVPWGAQGSGLVMGLDYFRYPEDNFGGYYGDDLLIRTDTHSTVPTPVTITPPAPASVTPTASTNTASVTWATSTGADAYDILQDGVRVATLAAPPYVSGVLNPGQAYVFSVKAVSAQGRKSAATAGAPVTPTAPITQDPILTDGSLVLIDPTNQFGEWSAGVPASIPNLAAPMAVDTAGTGTEADWAFLVTNNLTATDGLVERTSKGALHALISQATGVVSRYFRAGSEAFRAYRAANTGHAYYASAWICVTRLSLASPPGSAERFVGHLTSGASDVQGVRLVTNNKLSLAPSAGRTDTAESPTPAVLDTPYLIAGAHSTINTVGSDDTFIMAGNPTTGALNKNASFVLYRVYVEDLTVSGRTYAQVKAIDDQLYAIAFGTDGRYADDTHTAVSTLP